MKVLIASDKFKGSLSALEACQAMARGIASYNQDINKVVFPLADGGEGTASILAHHSNGRMIRCPSQDPLFRPIKSSYGLSGDGKTAFMEMAQASGLHLLTKQEYDPMLTSTYGTGLMILEAINNGVTSIILGIGGSGTNDGGIGMAAALGYKFYDGQGQSLAPIGKNLSKLKRIDDGNLLFDRGKVNIEVACDVQNPLFGPHGASFVYAAQKGASQKQIEYLDSGLRNLDKVISKDLGIDIASIPGAGAAGGLGGGTIAFVNAQLTPGIELIMKATSFDQALEGVDIIFTGEGKIDSQTQQGKVIAGVAKKAKERQIPVMAICGILELSVHECNELGLKHVRDLKSLTNTTEEAEKNASQLVQQRSEEMMALTTSH